VERNELERRRQARHILSLQANFVWTDAEGIDHGAQGITRDITSKGMFIYTDSPPPPKADLHIEVVLSAGEFEVFAPFLMQALALVVRIEPPQKPSLQGGFAILNKSYELLRGTAVVEEGF
jgi:hypothetical protein